MTSDQIHLTEQCLKNLKLADQPFGQNSPERYFEHQALSTQIAVAEQLVRSGAATVLVAGQAGFGKSTLLSKIAHHIETAGYRPLQIQANASTTGEEILQAFLTMHSAPPARPGQDLSAHVQAHIDILLSAGRTPVILVDNAETLNMHALRLLANLKSQLNAKSQSNLGLLLAVETDAHNAMPSQVTQLFPDSACHSLQLKALSQDQALAYLRHHLEHAGLPKDSKPAIRGFKKIYRASAGNPEALGSLAAKELERNYGKSPHSAIKPKALLSILLVLGIGVGGGWWAQQNGFDFGTLTSSDPAATTEPVSEEVEVSEQSLADQLKASWQEKQDEPAMINRSPEIENDLANPAAAQQGEPEALDLVAAEIAAMPNATVIESPTLQDAQTSTIGSTSDVAESINAQTNTTDANTSSAEIADSVAPKEAIGSAPPVQTNAEPNQEQQLEVVTTTSEANNAEINAEVTKPAPEMIAEIAPEPATAVTQTEESITAATTIQVEEPPKAVATLPETSPPKVLEQPAPKPEIKPVEVAATQPTIDTVTRNTEWVSAAPDQHYTLQLVGGSNPAKIEKFIKVVSPQINTAVYTTTRNNKPWYVVVGGNYASSAEAKQAVSTLPKWLQNNKPWPRRMSDIKKSIQQ